MKSVKEEALRAISSLPDDAPIDDVMYRLYVIDKNCSWTGGYQGWPGN
jgi:hypothetical protein